MWIGREHLFFMVGVTILLVIRLFLNIDRLHFLLNLII
jgi:hypothetical protein